MPAVTLSPVPAAQISGTFKVDGSGNVEFVEEDGIDYAAVTVQLPGGERVPFLFTIKELAVSTPPLGTRCPEDDLLGSRPRPRPSAQHALLLGTPGHRGPGMRRFRRAWWGCRRNMLQQVLFGLS